jgi:hypothetical protein
MISQDFSRRVSMQRTPLALAALVFGAAFTVSAHADEAALKAELDALKKENAGMRARLEQIEVRQRGSR